MRILGLFLLLSAVAAGSASAQDTLHVQLHGSVLNAVTGEPLYEVLVEWVDASGQRQAITQSNSEGHYAMFISTTGPIELRIDENGYTSYREKDIVFHLGESAREHDLHLVPEE